MKNDGQGRRAGTDDELISTQTNDQAEDFARLAQEMLASNGEHLRVERIAELAVETIDACDWCGVSVRATDGTISTPASTDPLVLEADRLQYGLGQGPCHEAIWRLDTGLVDDASNEPRWPDWSAAVAELGVGSVLSLRLARADGGALAALNLYAAKPYSFDHTDVAIASVFARHASTALADARTHDQLRTAIRSRQVIGVAQGILMQRFGLDLDQSFEVLRRYSQDHNVRLRVLAERLAASGGLPDDGTAPMEFLLESSLGLEPSPSEPQRR